MENAASTRIVVRASQIERGQFVIFPSVETTITDHRRVQAISRQQIRQTHIQDFAGLRLEYINNNSDIICPNIVLNYCPVRVITVTVQTEQ